MADDEFEPGIWTKPVSAEPDLVEAVSAEKNAERGSEGFVPDTSQELEALRSEIDRLRNSIQEIASSSKRLATAEFDELKASAEEKLKQNVFLSVGVAAVVGYFWGRTRR
jgi:ElaB/YqjD/DUF883 family membrane-anchored ribosome-binding protein